MRHLLTRPGRRKLADHHLAQAPDRLAAVRFGQKAPKLLQRDATPRGPRGRGGTGPSVGGNMALLRKSPADADATSAPVSTMPASPRYPATRFHAHREKLSLEVQFVWKIDTAE